MRRTNKAGDWQELVVLSDRDLEEPVPGADIRGPAVRVTFARYGRELRFSHTPGVIEESGAFRPVQHLHHRNLSRYQDLFWCTTLLVKVAQELGPETLAGEPYIIKRAVRSAMADLSKDAEPAPAPATQKKEPKLQPLSKPTLGVSIGDMLKAKQQK